MNLPSLLLLAAVILGVILAIRHLRKHRGPGCAGCCQESCQGCRNRIPPEP